jgi:hypothetical protein
MRGGPGGRGDELALEFRTLRIIGSALLFGPTAFLGVAIYLRDHLEHPLVERPTEGFVTWAALAFATVAVLVSLLLPRPKGGARAPVQGHLILRLALVEAASLLGSVAYLIEGAPVALGIAALCLGVIALAHFPTRDRVERLRRDAV